MKIASSDGTYGDTWAGAPAALMGRLLASVQAGTSPENAPDDDSCTETGSESTRDIKHRKIDAWYQKTPVSIGNRDKAQDDVLGSVIAGNIKERERANPVANRASLLGCLRWMPLADAAQKLKRTALPGARSAPPQSKAERAASSARNTGETQQSAPANFSVQ